MEKEKKNMFTTYLPKGRIAESERGNKEYFNAGLDQILFIPHWLSTALIIGYSLDSDIGSTAQYFMHSILCMCECR
jgi:hypothetical protein